MLSKHKLHWFQYRILHRILATNDLMIKMNIKQNNLEIEKLEHLFWHCNVVNRFGENIEQWIYNKSNYLINIDKLRAILEFRTLPKLIYQ